MQPGSGCHSSFHEATGFASVFKLDQFAGFAHRMGLKHVFALPRGHLVARFGKPTASSSKEQDFLNPKAASPISHHSIHKYFHKEEQAVLQSEAGAF